MRPPITKGNIHPGKVSGPTQGESNIQVSAVTVQSPASLMMSVHSGRKEHKEGIDQEWSAQPSGCSTATLTTVPSVTCLLTSKVNLFTAPYKLNAN